MSGILRKIIAEKGPIRKIGVVGMGYVGIPSAALFAASEAYDFVWGFQRNSISSGFKIDQLNRGVCPIDGKEPGLKDLIKKIVTAEKFRCTSDMAKISGVDAVTIAVGTSFRNPKKFDPDFDALVESLKNVGKYLSRGTLVVIESTVTPGTTEGLAREILEGESGFRAGKDFALAHAPERVMPGKLLINIQELDRVVGGFDPVSTERAVELYQPVLTAGKTIAMDAKSAEFSKTAENAMRDLQIAAVNELALYCEALGINFYDVRNAIDSLKGEGVSRAVLFPGAGVGGHCLPKDTYHLIKSLNGLETEHDFPTNSKSLFMHARDINDSMPIHMFKLTLSALQSVNKSPRGAKIALLGWAYNANTDDPRNTPAKSFRNLMLGKKAEVIIHDPHVRTNNDAQIHKDLDTVLKDSDVVAIFAAHDEYAKLDLDRIKRLTNKKFPILIDGRNVIDPEKAIQKGFVFRGIGRGDINHLPVK